MISNYHRAVLGVTATWCGAALLAAVLALLLWPFAVIFLLSMWKAPEPSPVRSRWLYRPDPEPWRMTWEEQRKR